MMLTARFTKSALLLPVSQTLEPMLPKESHPADEPANTAGLR